jgi:hypothetical protein
MTSSSSKGQLTERQQALLAVARFLVERNKRRTKRPSTAESNEGAQAACSKQQS